MVKRDSATSIDLTTVNADKGLKRARATVVVVDDLGALVAGATVRHAVEIPPNPTEGA